MKDDQLKQNVLDELKWEPSVTAAHIGVTAKNGVITLTGHVNNYMEKSAAEAAVGRVKGVKAIAEELDVRLPFSVKKADDDIAAAAIDRLKWNATLPVDSMKVKVEKGWVTLTGQVDWHFQKDAAAKDIRQIYGVVGISNDISIKSRVNVANLSNEIEHAINRSWFFDADNHVNVSATGGAVKLSGVVDTWHERDMAGSTAWAAPGATSVENNITVA